MSGQTSLRELALLFLRLGTVAFGGPAAHIAMLQDEVVTRRRWLSEERFLDLMSATNLIPGPNSTELAIHIGFERRRWAGLVVAGVCFIVPAMLMTGALGWVYVTYGNVPALGWVLWGVKPVILGVVAQAIWALAPKAAKTSWLRLLGLGAAVLAAVGVNELVVLFGAGAVSLISARPKDPRGGAARSRRRRWGARPVSSPCRRCSGSSSRPARCSSGAATCCSPSCAPTWCSGWAG